MTVLLVEQNANMALALAETGIVLETGRVILTGLGHELLESPEIRSAYLGI
ncbi:MAG: branched-chain amino acid transport system ATP-binding protein [Paracoccaceae bacterium]|jgi:branched-chain amino acid transport system ATP-binding protein